MTTFYLIRHGSCPGLGHKLWGRTPGVCLDEGGKAQVHHLAERFAEVGVQAVYSSPLERAWETAAAVARALELDVQQSPAFNEIDFGEWTGKSFEAISADERWQRFNTTRSTTRIPGGESFLDVQARAVGELERLASRHPAARVAIVSHADVIKAVVGYFAATPIDLWQRIEISLCSVSVVALNRDGPKLLAVNNTIELMK
jgi:broad specificity phosphatase PhoE